MISQATISTLLLFGALYIVVFVAPNREVVGYDCRMAEITPDVPIKIKEKCRELWKKNLTESK